MFGRMSHDTTAPPVKVSPFTVGERSGEHRLVGHYPWWKCGGYGTGLTSDFRLHWCSTIGLDVVFLACLLVPAFLDLVKGSSQRQRALTGQFGLVSSFFREDSRISYIFKVSWSFFSWLIDWLNRTTIEPDRMSTNRTSTWPSGL